MNNNTVLSTVQLLILDHAAPTIIMIAIDEQIKLHTLLSQLFLLSSIPTFIATRWFTVAPFGRHLPDEKQHKKWHGPKFNARLSWMLFESPNLIWSWYCCSHLCNRDVFFLDTEATMSSSQGGAIISLQHNHLQISTNTILLSLFTLHYINRAIIYPLRMNSNSNKVPLIVTLSASLVTTVNGYLQSFYLTQIQKYDPLSLTSLTLEDIQRWIGILLFFVGLGINVHSDGVLRNLRRYGPSGKSKEKQQVQQSSKPNHTYYIPYSPFFTYVSCPNFAGEILEWFGFAMASQFSLPSVAFLVYVIANLVPRAVAHHEWYLRKFDDYPVERRWAVIPFIV